MSNDRTGRILDVHHWRAAQRRRASRETEILRSLYAGKVERKQRSLDDILGPVPDPWGGAA